MNRRFLSLALAVAALLGSVTGASAAKESSLHLNFGSNDRHQNWPFAGKSRLPGSVSDPAQQELSGKIHTFAVKESNLLVKVYASDILSPHPSMGFRFGYKAGDFFEIPGQEGMVVAKVRMRAGSKGSAAGTPAIKTVSGADIKGGEAWTGKKNQGDEHEWVLEGVEPGAPVRLTITRSGICELQDLEVFYKNAKVKKPKKGSVEVVELVFNSETNEKGDLLFDLPTLAYTDKNAGNTITKTVGKYSFDFWAKNGVTKATSGGGKVISALSLNAEGMSSATKKHYGSEEPAAAWIKLPGIEGMKLVSVEMTTSATIPAKDRSSGVAGISSAIIDESGRGSADQVGDTSFAFSRTASMLLEDPEAGRPYYISIKDAKNFTVQKITLTYKK